MTEPLEFHPYTVWRMPEIGHDDKCYRIRDYIDDGGVTVTYWRLAGHRPSLRDSEDNYVLLTKEEYEAQTA